MRCSAKPSRATRSATRWCSAIERISYRALDATVEAVAGNLTRRGFAKGDRLALLLGNCFEFVYAVLPARAPASSWCR